MRYERIGGCNRSTSHPEAATNIASVVVLEMARYTKKVVLLLTSRQLCSMNTRNFKKKSL